MQCKFELTVALIHAYDYDSDGVGDGVGGGNAIGERR